MFTSHLVCHCQVSHVFFVFFYKVVELVGGGFVFNGLTSSSFIMFVSSQAVRQSGSQAVLLLMCCVSVSQAVDNQAVRQPDNVRLTWSGC